jgi:hypothetical protein
MEVMVVLGGAPRLDDDVNLILVPAWSTSTVLRMYSQKWRPQVWLGAPSKPGTTNPGGLREV